MMCNLVGFTFIIAIAIVFQGDARLNYYSIIATDLSLGVSMDILVHRAMRVGGCEIGNYGDPLSYTRFVWHTAVSMCILVTTRSTSAIAAVFMFPVTNNRFEIDGKWANDDITAFLMPSLYLITRTLMLDVYNRYTGGYVRVLHRTEAPAGQFEMHKNDESLNQFVIDDDSAPETTTVATTDE